MRSREKSYANATFIWCPSCSYCSCVHSSTGQCHGSLSYYSHLLTHHQYQHRQCKDPRTNEGPQDEGQRLQHCTVHVLHPLHPPRSSKQYDTEKASSLGLAKCDNVLLGYVTSPISSRVDLILLLGVITICQGLTQSFAGLIICRVLLGVFEAGFFPGMNLLFIIIGRF